MYNISAITMLFFYISKIFVMRKKITVKMKTPITYYWGKQTLAPYILALMPKHTAYVEAFCGWAAMLYAKPKSKVEVINDINDHIMAFYRTVKWDFEVLQWLIQQSLPNRKIHQEAENILKNSECYSEAKIAWAVWIQTNMSYGGAYLGSYGFDKTGEAHTRKIYNKKLSFNNEVTNRLERVNIECDDALAIIKRYDWPETFYYLDPPYQNSYQWPYKGYTHEDFVELLDLLKTIKGKFLLSHYPYDILSQYVLENNRSVLEIDRNLWMVQKEGKKVTEVLVANYDLEAVQKGEGSAWVEWGKD